MVATRHGASGRQKAHGVHAGAPQFVRDRRPRVARPGGVNQHAHFDAAADGAAKGLDKLVSAGVVVENVSRERNGFLRGFDGGEHGGKGFVAIDERLDFVAGGQRALDDAADGAREHFQMFRAFVLRFAEVPGNRAAESFVDAERNGAAADAVDAEHEIKHRAKHRQQPDEADPERGGAGIAFVEQGMNRGEQGGQKIEARSQVRPEPGDLVEPVHCSPFFMTKARRDASAVLEKDFPMLSVGGSAGNRILRVQLQYHGCKHDNRPHPGPLPRERENRSPLL